MKQKMKHLVSFVALLVMMVSMFSVWAFPATAAAEDDYASLLRRALVVNSAWEDCEEGDWVTFNYRGKLQTQQLDANFHFASYDDALQYITAKKLTDPVVLLCEGEYTETIEIKSNMTLLGPNAGIDANVPSNDPKVAWALNTEGRGDEAVIKCNIVVRLTATNADLTIDGLRFEEGGALVDTQRNSGASELTVINSVFDGAGNEGLSKRYALYLRSSGHARSVTLENLYVTNMNWSKPESAVETPDLSFIAPFFTELYADNIAYIDNKNGFLTHTWFATGVSPIVEVTNSCFYNTESSTPVGYALSMDNHSYEYDFANAVDLTVTAATDRPAASLKVHDNIFYQASGKTGVLHYEFVNAASVIDVQNNYVYADDKNADAGAAIMDSEFLLGSSSIDQSSCMIIKNNKLIGAYKIPSLLNANEATYIDMSDNYFATSSGVVVANPIFISNEAQRLVRDTFWVDEKMTKTQEEWTMDIGNWLLAWVDDFRYTADLLIYQASDLDEETITFETKDGFSVDLYNNAKLSADGVILGTDPSAKIPDNKLSSRLLGDDPYAPKAIYAKVTKEGDDSFTPIYTINIENMGSLDTMKSFSEEFPANYIMYNNEVAGIETGTVIPYRWKDEIYKFEAGVNIFSDISEIFAYAAKKGIASPTILLPAGVYTEELVLSGSCTILGEQSGINPNKTVVDSITKENVINSAWILNPEREQSKESELNACIRVAAGIDNYVIEIDGIKMGKYCSYVDDTERTGECVTIFKNVYAKDAGGGLNREGDANPYIFNFERNFAVNATDRNTMYMYDSRIDGADAKAVFGPYFETFVVDGIFFANATNLGQFCKNLRSRDIPDPYYSITNSYFYNNDHATQTGTYIFNFFDHQGNVAAKTNIVYNIDNNVFLNGHVYNRGFQVYFTGNNMKFSFTNNTLVQEGDKGTLFVSTKTSSRFHTTCKNQNVSDMMILKGNRLIGKNCLPCTGQTGSGTMIDWSGNYFAATYDGEALMPSAARRFEFVEGDSGNFEYEEATRVKIDYTFLDWDMTIRSDSSYPIEAKYDVTNGMYGTGSYNKTTKVYTDTVEADCETYDVPVIVGEYSTLKLYSNEDLSANSQVTKLSLPDTVNTYYAVVTSIDGSVSETVKMIINRKPNTENELFYMDGFLIDIEAKTITGYVNFDDQLTYSYSDAAIVTSAGATHVLYDEDNDIITQLMVRLPKTYFLDVTSESGNTTRYTLTFVDSSGIDLSESDAAAITYVEGMTRVDSTTFAGEMLNGETQFTFKPYTMLGGSYEVYNGSTKLTPNADGSYTVHNAGTSNLVLKAVAIAGNGVNKAEYKLNILKVKGSESELLAVEGAAKKDGYFLLNIGSADAAVLKAQVSTGATYQVYEDYNCKTLLKNNLVTAQKNSVTRALFDVFVKVTAEDGISTSIHKVTVQSQASGNDRATITGTVNKQTYTANFTGDKEYTLYLPAGTKSVNLKGGVIKDITNIDGEVTKDAVIASAQFYADRNKTIMIDSDAAIKLDQRITTVYAVVNVTTYLNVVDGVAYSSYITGFDGVVNIVSDRDVATYSDAATFKNHWVKSYVDYLNNGNYGIFMGDDAGKINVESKITRYEIAAVASRVMGLDVTKYTAQNTQLTYDDTVADWALPYVRAVGANKIMNGHSEGDKLYFDGSANATREQVIKVLVSVCMANDGITQEASAYYAANKATLDKAYDSHSFADSNMVAEWAVPYMRLAVSKYEMIHGSDDNGKLYLNPKKDITRAEVAKMIAVYYGYDS